MANEKSGNLAVVYVLAGSTPMSGATGAKLSGMNASGLVRSKEPIDVTQLGDAYKRRILGLGDNDLSAINGNLVSGDAGQAAVETAFANGTSIMVGVYFEGTASAGLQVECLVESIDKKAGTSGAVSFTPKFVSQGAAVALPVRS